MTLIMGNTEPGTPRARYSIWKSSKDRIILDKCYADISPAVFHTFWVQCWPSGPPYCWHRDGSSFWFCRHLFASIKKSNEWCAVNWFSFTSTLWVFVFDWLVSVCWIFPNLKALGFAWPLSFRRVLFPGVLVKLSIRRHLCVPRHQQAFCKPS